MASSASDIPYDQLIQDIADYVCGADDSEDSDDFGAAATEIARYSLIDSLGCAIGALDDLECVKLLGPIVPGAACAHGARVPGTEFQLDPATAAFNISCMVRWTDSNDTWVAAQTTHPSDDVGAILAVADWLSRTRSALEAPTIKTVLKAMVQAHEIQGVLGMGTQLNLYGIDHVLLVRVACAAVVTRMMGGTRAQIMAAVSLAFFDVPLCVHRFGSNTGPRKGWAAAQAASDAVRIGLMAVKGERGYPQVLSHAKWGLQKTFMRGDEFRRGGEFGSLVMENILFKIYPVVIHAQSSVECAVKLHPHIKNRIGEIAAIRLYTHARTLATIDKSGPLRNAADRDHCLQYAVAVALLQGALRPSDYEDTAAADPRIDRLRGLMTVIENPDYTACYLDPAQRANPNGIEIVFKDGSTTDLIETNYPAGHPARRVEGLPLLLEKFRANIARRYALPQQQSLFALCLDHEKLLNTPVNIFTSMWADGFASPVSA